MHKIFYILILYTACTHHRSGYYVQNKEGTTFKKLSLKYDRAELQLKHLNKPSALAKDEWVFIPTKKGLFPSYKLDHLLSFSKKVHWPLSKKKKISSFFGKRWGKRHEGIDITAEKGIEIISIADGRIIYSGSGLSGYGNLTIIQHAGGFHSAYAHARKNFTRRGQRVLRGQKIAEVGRTGRTTGYHLHFEIRHQSVAIDPCLIFTKFCTPKVF